MFRVSSGAGSQLLRLSVPLLPRVLIPFTGECEVPNDDTEVRKACQGCEGLTVPPDMENPGRKDREGQCAGQSLAHLHLRGRGVLPAAV